MFCFQCEQTAKNKGCEVKGVCGKTPEVAALQDLLVYILKGLGAIATEGRKVGVNEKDVNVFTCEAMFSTLTNVDFDGDRFVELIQRAVTIRDALKEKVKEKGGNIPDYDAVNYIPPTTKEEMIKEGEKHGIRADNLPEDILSLRETLIYGIKGVESANWEYTTTASNHNQYHGENRTSNAYSDTSTISHLCCECHGVFHTAAGATFASPWIRHPTDFDLSDATGTEYQYYNGGDGTTNDYSPIAPVAADMSSLDASTASGTMVVSNIFSAPGALTGKDIAIVTCISCHRAHGSEYNDLLRWDYDNIQAGGGQSNTGCFICHTTKDDNS